MPAAFWSWWQHLPQRVDPVLFQIGWFRLQYYGLMYVLAFGTTYALVCYRLSREAGFAVSREQVKDLMLHLIVGLMVGARLGYVLFYNLPYYAGRPWEVVLPFDFSNGITFTGISGMSFHGGLIGALLGGWLCVRRADLDFWRMADLFVPVIPLGYTFGRLGNFINGELYGRITSLPIGMYFPTDPERALRHPSQLYEALFEGVFLFGLLWYLRRFSTPRGAMLAFYLIGYGSVRFLIEYVRQPDAQLGLVAGSFTMGQVLCGLMIIGGAWLFLHLKRSALRG